MNRSSEKFALKHTNSKRLIHQKTTPPSNLTDALGTVSRPQLAHASSKQSVSAIEEYQSARTSRPTSTESHDGPAHNNGFSTPPSSPTLPLRNPAHIRPRDIVTTQRPVATTMGEAPERQSIRFVDNSIRRKPVGSTARASNTSSSQMITDPSPPTPNVDDTPYIQFAIDQLTRDEEVRGSRKYTFPNEGRASLETSPRKLEREPDDARDSSGEQQRDLFSTPQEEPSSPKPDPVRAQQTYPPRTTSRRPIVEQEEDPRHPPIFVPFDQEIPPLRFLPKILRPSMLAIYLILCILMLIALLFSGIWSGTHAGLYGYTTFGGARYFLFQYLPTICGVVLLFWLFQIQIATQRVAPFIAMASMSTKSRGQAPLMEMLPSGFLRPKLLYFRAGQPVIGICMVIFWLQIFTVPLLSCVYNTYYYEESSSGSWKWTTVQGVVWTLFALYLLLTLAVITLGVWINRQRTGLRYDARSLADLIALLDKSNIFSDYAGSEAFTSAREFQKQLSDRSDRLGYWHASNRPTETFYTIGEEGADTRRYSLNRGKVREIGEKEGAGRSSFFLDRSSLSSETRTDQQVDLESGSHYEHIRFRFLPWFLRPSMISLWCSAAFVLYLAFLIVSFVNRAVVHGFAPLTPVAPTAAGFSATNFTYSFIPTIIAQFLFLAWLSVDYAFRRLQPYAAMSARHGRGASATESLLLDYPALLPFSVTISALAGRDWHVVWFSTMSLISGTLPVLAGGTFWAQFYVREQQVRVAVNAPGYYALCVFLGLYALSLPLAFFGLGDRKLPHDIKSVAEQISWLYQSNILGEREWRAPLGTKPEMASRLVTAKTEQERHPDMGSEGRFIFGRFIGRDGQTHLGIDRVGRHGTRLSVIDRTLGDNGSRYTGGERYATRRSRRETQMSPGTQDRRFSEIPTPPERRFGGISTAGGY